ncbi:MAG: MFS transporter [Chloroflexota bacterium]|jgi:MFS family permease
MSEYATLLRKNPDYRLLWLGSVVSQLGDWFNLIGSASLVANLSGTGTAISYLFLARFLPLFLFSPLAGILADRYERRHVMVASDLLRAATVMAFLLVREPGQIWLLYVLTFTQFALSAIFTPARSAVLANVVHRDELVPANALDSLTWSTMLAFGALLGGIVAATLGIAQAFFLDAMTFVLSAVLISRITGPIRAERTAAPRGGYFEFLDGLRYLRQQTFILGVALVKAGGALAWGAINVLEITFANEIFQLDFSVGGTSLAVNIDSGTAVLGVIYFVSGLGTGLGPLILRRWLGDAPIRQRWAISLGFGLMALGLVSLSIAPTLGLFSLATLVRTVGSGTIWVFSAALLQMIVPDQFRGRVFAFEFAALTLTQSISTFWAGFAQDTLGLSVQQVSFTMAIVAAVVGLSWIVFNARYLSRPMITGETRETV